MFTSLQAANDPPPPELLPVTTVRATHSQLTKRLGLASKDLIGQRLRDALDAGAIIRANPGAARSAGGEYQIVTTSAALAAGKSASTALPHPAAVAAMQADPTRLAEILSRIDAEIAANEQATPGSPGLQPAAALASIRERIEIVKAEISHLQTLPVPGDDLEERIERYVEALAARGEPVVQGIGNGQTLRVHYPVTDNANRVNLTGFSTDQADPLLLSALLHPERLTERLLQVIGHTSIPRDARDERLRHLNRQLTELRYDEEAALMVEDGVRKPAPAWAVLQVKVQDREVAAA